MNDSTKLLKELAVRANNILMKGQFSGDDAREAVVIQDICIEIVKTITSAEQAEAAQNVDPKKEA